MTAYLTSTVVLILAIGPGSTTSHGQASRQSNKPDQIIFSDSLFSKQSDEYDFDIVTNNIVHNVKRDDINDLNEIISVDNDYINFRISYACGCGTNEKILITNGQLHQDNKGHNYYEIKLLFTNHNKGCQRHCHDKLSFDISSFKNPQTVVYLKFVGFEQLIKYK